MALLIRWYGGGRMRGGSPSPPLGPRTAAPGYEQYQKSLLEVPWPPTEYGEASSDDLSSEWDSDVQETSSTSKIREVINHSVCVYCIPVPVCYLFSGVMTTSSSVTYVMFPRTGSWLSEDDPPARHLGMLPGRISPARLVITSI
ncbi:hypothetical protein J6590_036208 [Homalodisca vitripennis]|nr:hypothetical protein J6590_036208 [Homalodisca vitripennis]